MNTAFLNYLLEANLGLLLFYSTYWLFLRHETNFQFLRIYLVGSLILSFTFPLIEIGTPNHTIPSIGEALPPHFLPEVMVGNANNPSTINTTPMTNYWQIFWWCYLGGCLFFAARLSTQLWVVFKMIRHGKFCRDIGKYTVLESFHDAPSFSFFHYIVLGDMHTLTEEDKNYILQHELVHAQKLHSLDVLLLEVIRIVAWFNPAVYRFKKCISDIHEFQADENAVRNKDVQKYCSLLARITLQSAGYSLANHFNRSLTLKRINMMKTIKRKLRPWKLAVVASLAVALFVGISCQEQVTEDLQTIVDNSATAVDLPPKVQAFYDKIKAESTDAQFVVLEMNDTGHEKLKALEEKYNLDDIHGITIYEGEQEMKTSRNFLVIRYSEQVEQLAKQTTNTVNGEEVFLVVEESATPVGGMEKLYEYVGKKLKYPANALAKRTSGRVFVEFVVLKDGSVTNVRVIKGIGDGCDEEAMRVVQNSPKWNPGKQRGKAVAQKMVLPIVFNPGSGIEVGSNESTIQEVTQPMLIKFKQVHIDGNETLVTGQVTDQDGKFLAGTSIVVKGTTYGTVVDKDGNFKITLQKNQELAFSHIGFETKIITPKL